MNFTVYTLCTFGTANPASICWTFLGIFSLSRRVSTPFIFICRITKPRIRALCVHLGITEPIGLKTSIPASVFQSLDQFSLHKYGFLWAYGSYFVKDSFLRAFREVAPEMELLQKNHEQYMKNFAIKLIYKQMSNGPFKFSGRGKSINSLRKQS